ncbi:hypothetical protein GCM10007877_22820 [Marinibactrum halimedae]|uniref:HTH tetR-type domain-containing protein n=1 Tax=Marinibactrum halimedae TaxID=1444977 RepID=A0AA37T672_9GAMM|nr:hypothetical protein GCM10007877_22820 [Marinibactrum halimedae]
MNHSVNKTNSIKQNAVTQHPKTPHSTEQNETILSSHTPTISRENISKRERILDAAEILFAQHGYDGVTLREIAKTAAVDVALANYHFGKKLDLFHAVFDRRATLLSETRQMLLHRNNDKPQTLEQIIEAFLLPLKMAQKTGDAGWRHYLALLAQVMISPVWNTELMPSVFDKRVSEFISALQEVFPHADETKLHWCYHYMSGALALTLAQTGRIDRISNGKCRSVDFDAAYENMVPFMAAALRGVCDISAEIEK